MSFGNNDREYARPAALPDWLKDFADSELKKGGTPFSEGSDSPRKKESAAAVEEKVSELRSKVGLDLIESSDDKVVRASMNKSAEGGKHKELIPGGLAEGKEDEEFDKKQIQKGVKVEKEHTPDPNVAKEISKDHLVENDKYYDHLEEMEKKMDKESKTALVMFLISQAERAEAAGDARAAMTADRLLQKVAEEGKCDKCQKGVFSKNPKLKGIVDNICHSRGGHVDAPAIVQTLGSGKVDGLHFSDQEMSELKDYVSRKLEEERNFSKEGLETGDADPTGMSYVVFVVNEQDDSDRKVFNEPARIK